MQMKPKAAKNYRLCPWADRDTDKSKYGIQVKLVGFHLRWLHCMQDGVPLLFDDADECRAKMREMRKADKLELTNS